MKKKMEAEWARQRQEQSQFNDSSVSSVADA